MDKICSHKKQEFLCHFDQCPIPLAYVCSNCMFEYHNEHTNCFIHQDELKKLVEMKFSDKTRLFYYNIDFQLTLNIDQLFDSLLKILEKQLNELKIQIKSQLDILDKESLVPNLVNLTFGKPTNLGPSDISHLLNVSTLKMADLFVLTDDRIAKAQNLILEKLSSLFRNFIPANQKDLTQFNIDNKLIREFDEKYNYDSILQKSRNNFHLPHFLKYPNGDQYYGQTLLGVIPDGYGQLYCQKKFKENVNQDTPLLISAVFDKGMPTIGIETYLNQKNQIEFSIVGMNEEKPNEEVSEKKDKGCFVQ